MIKFTLDCYDGEKYANKKLTEEELNRYYQKLKDLYDETPDDDETPELDERTYYSIDVLGSEDELKEYLDSIDSKIREIEHHYGTMDYEGTAGISCGWSTYEFGNNSLQAWIELLNLLEKRFVLENAVVEVSVIDTVYGEEFELD